MTQMRSNGVWGEPYGFHVGRQEMRSGSDAADQRAERRPLLLHATDRDSCDVAVPRFGEVNRRRSDATADVEHALPAAQSSLADDRFHEVGLRVGWTLGGIPQSVMDMSTPKQAIERGRQVGRQTDRAFFNRRTADHDRDSSGC